MNRLRALGLVLAFAAALLSAHTAAARRGGIVAEGCEGCHRAGQEPAVQILDRTRREGEAERQQPHARSVRIAAIGRNRPTSPERFKEPRTRGPSGETLICR